MPSPAGKGRAASPPSGSRPRVSPRTTKPKSGHSHKPTSPGRFRERSRSRDLPRSTKPKAGQPYKSPERNPKRVEQRNEGNEEESPHEVATYDIYQALQNGEVLDDMELINGLQEMIEGATTVDAESA